MPLPELRPLLLALLTVHVVKAIKLVCAVPAGVRPRSGLRGAQSGLAGFQDTGPECEAAAKGAEAKAIAFFGIREHIRQAQRDAGR